MKPEVKKLWVEALRSGKYQQGRTHLRRGGQYCCLGVLCELYRQSTGFGEWRHLHSEEGESRAPFLFETVLGKSWSYPTLAVTVWAELGAAKGGGKRDVETTFRVLTAKNDRGASFDQIADYIEEEL